MYMDTRFWLPFVVAGGLTSWLLFGAPGDGLGLESEEAGSPWLVTHVEAVHCSLAQATDLLLNRETLLILLLLLLASLAQERIISSLPSLSSSHLSYLNKDKMSIGPKFLINKETDKHTTKQKDRQTHK